MGGLFRTLFRLLPLLLIVGIFAGSMPDAGVRYRDVTDMVRKLMAAVEMRFHAQTVGQYYLDKGRLPRNVKKYLARHSISRRVKNPFVNREKKRHPAQDPWGKLYRFRKMKGGFTVTSAGPDGRFRTGDDIRIKYIPKRYDE